VSQSGGHGYGGGGGAGKANFNDIQFTHRVDKATPRLFQACATGEHIKGALLTVRKAGKEQQEYYTCKLSDLLITGVHGGGSGHDEVPVENVSLNYAKIEFEYKPQKADGTLDSGIKFGYDLKANKQA
jgi:type VI secretion system secreted protein Hcp